jgi:2-polyprenyl-6-methoxyphenol hydroxylase-like FAD-dependent oxidoreductase
MPGPQSVSYDAIIVGARAAGAATAMLLARAGARVLLVDQDAPGTDTVSTHALMRAGVMLLQQWGLLGRIIAAGTPPVRSTQFLYGSQEVVVPIKPAAGVDALYAPRRTVLDAILAEAAVDAGAELRYHCALQDVIRDRAGRVTGAVLHAGDTSGPVAAGLVIGADGRRSKVARLVGSDVRHAGVHATATLYAYVEGMADRGYRWHYGQGAAGGAIPTNGGLQVVFAGLRPEQLRACRGNLAQGLVGGLQAAGSPLAGELAALGLASRPVGFAGLPGYLREATGPGWALVGDAGYFKDPITAHGLTDAFRDAALLADAIRAGTATAMRLYESTRDALSLPFLLATDALASLDWTLDEAQALHGRIQAAMRAEVQLLSCGVSDSAKGAARLQHQ